VVSVAAGALEDVGGAAEDCAGGGAGLVVGCGAADDCAGGADEGAGAWDEGAGAGEDGGSAVVGRLDCGAAGEEGAGAAVVSAGGVTDGAAADEAGGEGGGEGADCAAGLEGATKEETNVLAVPLLAMVTTIATRNGAQKNAEAGKAARRPGYSVAARAEKQRVRSTTTVSGREDVSVAECGSQRLGGPFRRASGQRREDLGASEPVER
jgi:hypothetical protein